jgi:hypothetical protein
MSDGRSAARLALFEGYRDRGTSAWIRAEGTSMLPSIPSGTWLLVEFGRTEPRVGEIVVVPCGDRLVSHRVVALAGSVVVTKGDARRYFDSPVAVSEILGIARGLRRVEAGRIRTGTCAGARAAAIARFSRGSGRVAALASKSRHRVARAA